MMCRPDERRAPRGSAAVAVVVGAHRRWIGGPASPRVRERGLVPPRLAGRRCAGVGTCGARASHDMMRTAIFGDLLLLVACGPTGTRCTFNNDCNAGLNCTAQTCVQRTPCNSNVDCATGLTCIADGVKSECVNLTGGDGAVGTACTSNAECRPGLTCISDGTSSKCVDLAGGLGVVGAACSSNAGCAAGLDCISDGPGSRCAKPCPVNLVTCDRWADTAGREPNRCCNPLVQSCDSTTRTPPECRQRCRDNSDCGSVTCCNSSTGTCQGCAPNSLPGSPHCGVPSGYCVF